MAKQRKARETIEKMSDEEVSDVLSKGLSGLASVFGGSEIPKPVIVTLMLTYLLQDEDGETGLDIMSEALAYFASATANISNLNPYEVMLDVVVEAKDKLDERIYADPLEDLTMSADESNAN